LATALGVSAHRMQVMKASFFGESQQPPLTPSKQAKNISSGKGVFQGVSLLSHGDSHDSALFASPKRG